jgi:hypothetical protein
MVVDVGDGSVVWDIRRGEQRRRRGEWWNWERLSFEYGFWEGRA